MNDKIKIDDLEFLKKFIKSLDENNKVFKLSNELMNIKEKINDKNKTKILKENKQNNYK